MFFDLDPLTWYNMLFAASVVGAAICAVLSVMRWWTGGFAESAAAPRPGRPEPPGNVRNALVRIFGAGHRKATVVGLTIFFLMWGLAGYTLNDLIIPEVVSRLPYVKRYTLWEIRFIVGCVVLLNATVGAGIAVVVARLLTPYALNALLTGKTSHSSADFVGSRAEVSTILGPRESGMIVIDAGSGMVTAKAKLVKYEGPPLKRGEDVLIVDYEEGTYVCVPWKTIVE